MTLWAAAIVILVGIAAYPATAQQRNGEPAQPAPTQGGTIWQGLEILPTPYLWLPAISVDVRPANTRFSSRSSTIDQGKLTSNLTWVPFMGEVEFRAGQYGLLVDYIHVPLKAGISTHNILFNGASGAPTLDTGTAMFLYRALTAPDQYVDIGAGMRAWGLTGSVSLNEGLLPALNVSNGLSWADPLIAARYHRELGNGFSATAYADVGGFGLGAHIDWQLIGTIDYAAASWIDLHGGFRSLNFNYGAKRADFNVNTYGPIIAGTFHF
jgi:hypothetical protein